MRSPDLPDGWEPEPPAPRRLSLESIQPVVVAWLTLVWVLLWGDLSVANVVVGAAVATLVLVVFPLPPLRMRLRVRPLWLVWLIVHFLGSVVLATAQVAWTTLSFGRTPRNAVIRVTLLTSSDFVLTVVAELTSLVPGSIVLEADRFSHSLYIHVLDVDTPDDVEKIRAATMALERRVVMALGADVDHLELAAGTAAGGSSPPRPSSLTRLSRRSSSSRPSRRSRPPSAPDPSSPSDEESP